MNDLDTTLAEARACTLCAGHLPFAPRPVLRASATARLVIVGQAPGTRVHETGIPWNDASGDRLRAWLDLDREAFYDDRRIAIVPMGRNCWSALGGSSPNVLRRVAPVLSKACIGLNGSTVGPTCTATAGTGPKVVRWLSIAIDSYALTKTLTDCWKKASRLPAVC